MSDEIELKFALATTAVPQFIRQVAQYDCLETAQIYLANTYYDSPDNYFAQHKMGLRVRQQDQQFTLTLKTDGKVLGGLHIRPEYNVPLPSAEPDLSQLQQFHLALPSHLTLTPIFSTDFTRQFWLIRTPKADIEVAFDQGEIKAQGKSLPICEVEFELKQGTVQDLLAFIAQLDLPNGVYFSALSKAKRGYQLAHSVSVKPTDWIAQWRTIWALEKTPKIMTALFQYEQALQEETLNLAADYFADDFLRCVERIGAFFNLYHYYGENASLLAQGISDQATWQQILDSNANMLNMLQQIIRSHSENKDNWLAITQLIEQLSRADYLQRMLNLLRLSLEI